MGVLDELWGFLPEDPQQAQDDAAWEAQYMADLSRPQIGEAATKGVGAVTDMLGIGKAPPPPPPKAPVWGVPANAPAAAAPAPAKKAGKSGKKKAAPAEQEFDDPPAEELPEGWSWQQKGSGEWVKVSPEGEAVPAGGVPSVGNQVDVNAVPAAPGEWDEYLENPQNPAGGPAARPPDTRESILEEGRVLDESPVPTNADGYRELDMDLKRREWDRQAGLTPEQAAADSALREFDRQKIGIDGMAEAAAKSRKDAEDNLSTLLKARKDTEAEKQRIMAQPTWWEGRSAGQKVAFFVDAAFSGMLAAFQGSNKNAALDNMHAAIDQDAEERAAEYARASQGAVDADELYKLKELVRLRGLEEAKQGYLSQMQQYDQRGSMVMFGMSAVRDIEARQAEAEQKVLEHNWKKGLAEQKMRSDEIQKAADLAQRERESRRQAWVTTRGQDLNAQAARDTLEASKTGADARYANARADNAEFEAIKNSRADVIIDPGNIVNGKPAVIGRPRDFEKRADVQVGINAYSKLRNQLKDLIDYTKTEGRAGKLTAKRDVINQKRELIAHTYAKIVDSVGAVSDKTIEAAAAVIPDADGWIKRWQHTDEIYKSLVRNADEGMEIVANAGIEGYQPGSLSSRYVDFDRQMFAPEPTEMDLAAERARGDSPGMYPPGTSLHEAAAEGEAERKKTPPPAEEEPSYAPVDDGDSGWDQYLEDE